MAVLGPLFLFALVCYPAAALAAEWSVPPEHPRLLMNRSDAAAIRVRCGIDAPSANNGGPRIKSGSQQEGFERLKAAAGRIMSDSARTDDLFAPALMHVITGDWNEPDAYSRYVAESLLDPHRQRFELDALVSLDWCWDAIDGQRRSRILDRLPLAPARMDANLSPLNHLAFYGALCGLAQTLVRYDSAGPAAETRTLVGVLSADQQYLAGPFVDFCRQRGAMPTSGENGIWEEADYTLAIELLRTGLNYNLWPELTESIGRSLEHYFYADTDYPALNHGFLHDDGTSCPAQPGQVYTGFVPAVPLAIARQTRDPVASWYASRSLPRLEPPAADVERYTWVRLLYGPVESAEAARRACPLGRNFGGGWVAMRTGWGLGDTVLLFDAGQPFWRSRQHFDAGHFLIYHKGRLTLQSGDDVTFEAVPEKQGQCLMGEHPGDWDQYFRSTIAHNCVTVADPGLVQRLYGRPWPAMGNQRLIGRDYMPADGDLVKAGRETGHLLAFQTNSFYTFAASDLTPAYPSSVVNALRREILTLNAGAIVVLDHLATHQDRLVKTWNLQLTAKPDFMVLPGSTASSAIPETAPETPTAEISGAKQIFGIERDGGIWQPLRDREWLRVTEGEGSLLVRTLLPVRVSRRVVGGPGRPLEIPAGPCFGRTYWGSDLRGFEYRLGPASITAIANASYQLNKPGSLGEQFGTGAHWGRYEASPIDPGRDTVFLHVLIPTDRNHAEPPGVHVEVSDGPETIQITLGQQVVKIELNARGTSIAKVSFQDSVGHVLYEKPLTLEVSANSPIPGGTLMRE